MNRIELRGFSALAILLILLFSSAATASESKIHRLVVFGDSLSDIGNDFILSNEEFYGEVQIPPLTRYANGRFSNGPVWVEYLAGLLDIKQRKFLPSLHDKMKLNKAYSVSYAYGGSGTSLENETPGAVLPPITVRGLLGQVADYTSEAKTKNYRKTLFVILTGANDYLLSDSPGIPYPPSPVTTVGNIMSAIEQLYLSGARKFLVVNLPDLGMTPLAAILGPETQASLSQVTQVHNGLLFEQLTAVSETYEDASFYHLDVYSLLGVVASNPQAFGFSNTFTDPGPAANCLIPLTPDANCDPLPDGLDAKGSVFWDAQHPTTALHRYFGFVAYLCLKYPKTCEV